MTKVINIQGTKETYIYCGRTRLPRAHYGNPASHLSYGTATVRVATRAEAIQFCTDWLDGKHPEVEPERRQWILDNLAGLKDKTLGCFCKPLPCHCDDLARRADAT